MPIAVQTTTTINCPDCDVRCQRFGGHRNGLRRFRCPLCLKTHTEEHRLKLGEMYVREDRAMLAIQLLLEGNSVRSTMRITNLDKSTILKILNLAGERCEKLMGRVIVNVPVKDVQADEIWGYVQKKEQHKRPEEAHDGSIGDAYC